MLVNGDPLAVTAMEHDRFPLVHSELSFIRGYLAPHGVRENGNVPEELNALIGRHTRSHAETDVR